MGGGRGSIRFFIFNFSSWFSLLNFGSFITGNYFSYQLYSNPRYLKKKKKKSYREQIVSSAHGLGVLILLRLPVLDHLYFEWFQLCPFFRKIM